MHVLNIVSLSYDVAVLQWITSCHKLCCMYDHALRESAANVNLFKVFSLYLICGSTIYNKAFKTKIAIVYCFFVCFFYVFFFFFFELHAFEWIAYIQSGKFTKFCFIFIQLINVSPEVYVMENTL